MKKGVISKSSRQLTNERREAKQEWAVFEDLDE